MTLYINSCVREDSRTDRIARALLEKLGGEITELKLERERRLKPLDGELLAYRSACIAAGDCSDAMFDYAKQFAAAELIVIAAPFWDDSFPALLKIYLENVYVTGIVSRYGADGIPVGLCRAKKLYYVTTAGGPLLPAFGFDYVKALAQTAFGIPGVELVAAEMLDVEGFDAEQIVADTIARL